MSIEHRKNFGIYHWDTFDNNTFLIGESTSLTGAIKIVKTKYKGCISEHGADRVDIVDKNGNVVKCYRVR